MNAQVLSQDPQFREFFETVAPFLHAYRYRLFTFVALVSETEDLVLRASLRLLVFPTSPLKPAMRSAGLRAGEEWIAVPPQNTELFLCDGVTDRFVLQDGLLAFPREQHGAISAAFQQPWAAGVRDASFVARLSLGGRSRWNLLSARQSRLERELLTLRRPFKSLAAWTSEYGFNLGSSDNVLLEVFADKIAWIDRTRSRVSGTRVEIWIRLAGCLDPSQFKFARQAFGVDNKHLLVASLGQPFVLSLESREPDNVVESIMNTVKDATSRQLTRRRAGIICVKLETITAAELEELGTETGAPSALRRATSTFLNKADSAHVICLGFFSHGPLTRKEGGAVTQGGVSYFFQRPESPLFNAIPGMAFGEVQNTLPA